MVVASLGSSLVALKLRRIREIHNAETANESAATDITQTSGMNDINAPASSGPATCAAEKVAWMRPLAATRSSVETRLGIAANSPALKAMNTVDWMKVTA